MEPVSGSQGGGLGDILSLALKKTGVSSGRTPQQLSHGEPSSVLTEAAGAINDSLLSSDLKTLTQGLFSDLASAKSSQNSTEADTKESIPGLASPSVNGSGLVHTPNQCSTIPEPLSMPVLVKPPSTPEQYHQSTYAQNLIQNRPISTPSVTTALTPVVSVSGSFSGITSNVQQAVPSFNSREGAPPLANTSQISTCEQADPSQYDYSNVLHGDDIDLDRLDEFLATDPMDLPPPPPFQNHQMPAAYSSQHAPINGQGLHQQPGGVVPAPGLNSGSSGLPPYTAATTNQQPQQQQYHHQRQHQPQPPPPPQYGVQRPVMTPYQSPTSMLPPQSRPLQQPQPHPQQQMVSTPSINGGHYSTATPSAPLATTDLSNILPSETSLSAPQSNGEMVSLSEADIHSILDLDSAMDLDFLGSDGDPFSLESNLPTDPFSSFGMSSMDLIQPSNTRQFTGATTAALVSSSVGPAVNAPPQMQYGVQRPIVTNTRPGYASIQQQPGFRQKLSMHPMFGGAATGQTHRMSSVIPRARMAAGRGSAVPMPQQAGVSEVCNVIWLSSLCLLCQRIHMYLLMG